MDLVLSCAQREAMEKIIDISRNKKISCYLVGGAVRDGMLQIPPRDIDICINTEPMEIIEALELEDYVYHAEFHTSTVRFKNGVEFDIIRCRKEAYPFQGALPVVFPSDLKDDLERRDFTINAIAYDLLKKEIIDPYNGAYDIENKIVRSVHKGSYKEDPTRLFRAVKYCCRYNFSLYEIQEIKECIRNNVLDSISSDRYVNEICSMCSENKWEDMLNLCSTLGMFMLEKYDNINVLADLKDTDVRFMKFAYMVRDEKTLEKIINNSIIHKELKKALAVLKGSIRQQLYASRDNHEIYEILNKSSYLEQVMLCFDQKLTYKVINYIMLSAIKTELNGNYVKKAADAIEGRMVGRILDYIMRIKLNTGLMDDVKYFNENLGEIINVIEH